MDIRHLKKLHRKVCAKIRETGIVYECDGCDKCPLKEKCIKASGNSLFYGAGKRFKFIMLSVQHCVKCREKQENEQPILKG